MYRVLKDFTDLQDNGHFYHVGDIFPHDDLKVDRKRLSELSSSKNRQGVPLIEKMPDNEKKLEGNTSRKSRKKVEVEDSI